MSTAFKSLYLHFPFCESKCHYCDFYSIGREKTKIQDPMTFEGALHQECSLLTDQLAPKLDSIFMGGGTPSMTPPEQMKKSLEPLKLDARVDPNHTEWTMEANPSSVDLEKLKAYRALGVNRISMGVQSLRPDLLTMLGRVHSRENVFKALDAIFEAGFDNVSVDLLCGVPGQSVEDVEKAMDELTKYPITHLSCYLLTLHKTHKMYKDLPNEDEQLNHLLTIDRVMTAKGFEHYEISNFAKPGRRAKHNLAYWTGKSYLGLGPSAHSYDSEKNQRFKNVSSLHAYAEKLKKGELPREWTEDLTEEQKNLEQWMLALRLEEGFPRDWLKTPQQKSKADLFLKQGLLMDHSKITGNLRLTARGFALSEQIISALA